MFALAAIIFALIVILYYDFQDNPDYPDDKEIKMFDLVEYPLFFGIAILNFEGNPSALNVQASMKVPKRFPQVLIISAVAISTLVVVVSSFSYLAYGKYVEDLVTLNLPHTPITTIVRLLYCGGLLASYPLQLFAAVDIIEKFEIYDKIPSLPWWREVSFR